MKLYSGKTWSLPMNLFIIVFMIFGLVSRAEALNCNILSPGFSTAYSGTAPNITQSSFTVTCTRTAGDPNPYTFAYTVGVNNGANSAASPNLAISGANTIQYDTYKDSGCATLWGANGGARFSGSMTLNNLVPVSQTTNFWGCITLANQAPPGGTYLDTVRMTFYVPGPNPTGNFSVSIFYQGTCTLTTTPGNVAFSYTSFQVAAASASTTFRISCSKFLPYTMALDAYSGILPATGLTYNLIVKDSLAATVLSTTQETGSGLAQNYTITGSMAAGQSGTCALASCLDTQARTLTITY